VECVKTPNFSRVSLGMPDITPDSGRLTLSSVSVSTAAKTRTPSTVKSQSLLPLCGNSFYDESDSEHSRSLRTFSPSGTEFSSFSVSGVMEQSCDMSSLPSWKTVIRSRESTPSTCSSNVHNHTQLSTPSTVKSFSLSCDNTDTWLTSQQPNTTSVNSLPRTPFNASLHSTSSAAATTLAACSSPSDGLLACTLSVKYLY